MLLHFDAHEFCKAFNAQGIGFVSFSEQDSHSAQPFRFSDRVARLSIVCILTQSRESTGPRFKVALDPLALYDAPVQKI
jgi:hypothetical protein